MASADEDRTLARLRALRTDVIDPIIASQNGRVFKRTGETHKIGERRVELVFRDGVGPASPYSILLAENIPDLTGQTVVDLGTGSGLLAIVARLRGPNASIC
jgi:hypothetical protein